MHEIEPMFDIRDQKTKAEISDCPFALVATIALSITGSGKPMTVCLNFKELKAKFCKITLQSPVFMHGIGNPQHCIQAYVSDRPFERWLDIKLYHGHLMTSAMISQDEWNKNLLAINKHYGQIFQKSHRQPALA